MNMEYNDFSIWNGVDLHIHSPKSNEVKPNDYDGATFSASELLDTLLENDINIFSITDHNCFNTSLYEDLSSLVKEDKYVNRINYVPGVELDVNDKDIYANDTFHCLVLFDTNDFSLIDKAISELFSNKKESERNNDALYPSINEIFTVFNKCGIKNLILIPHYRDKHKGISYKKEDTNKLLENLNRLCFNAYEDSNNTSLLSKSLKCYLDCNCDFPFVAFSDNHDLKKYPQGKNVNDKSTKCYMLSNVKYPFNSIKTAFEEPRLRVSLDGVDGVRNTNADNKYIQSFSLGNKEYPLSPYCNTIIGRFGSGKTLLLKRIISGNKGLKDNEHYKDFYDKQPTFQIKINGSSYESVENSGDTLKWYELAQKEEYSYKSFFRAEDINSLFKKLKLSYKCAEDIKFEYNKENLINSYQSLVNALKNKSTTNYLEFQKAFRNGNYYSVSKGKQFDIQSVIELINNNNLESIIGAKIEDISVFSEAESKALNFADEIIKKKNDVLKLYQNQQPYNQIVNAIKEYNEAYIQNEEKIKADNLLSDFKTMCKSIDNFCEQTCILSGMLKKSKYDEITTPNKEVLFGDYSVERTYESNDSYPTIVDLFASGNCKKADLFKTVLNIEYNNESYRNKNIFEKCLDNYLAKLNGLFKKENAKYDIYKGDDSLLKKSSGEKASLFMNLLFDLIDNDIANNKSIALFLDQPEYDIDNKNIYDTITKKITELKKKSVLFQCIIITHNGNVGIGIDSENILIARDITLDNNIKQFDYRSGCIEDTLFIKEVCDILEGGKEAMMKRTSKYGINIIKKVTENET